MLADVLKQERRDRLAAEVQQQQALRSIVRKLKEEQAEERRRMADELAHLQQRCVPTPDRRRRRSDDGNDDGARRRDAHVLDGRAVHAAWERIERRALRAQPLSARLPLARDVGMATSSENVRRLIKAYRG
jgi:hypothetical protein